MSATLADFVAFSDISQTDKRYAQAQGVLDAAAEWVEDTVGVRGGSPVFEVRPQGKALILPAVGVASVVEVTDPDDVTVTPYDVDKAAGIVWLETVSTTPGPYTVTVTTDTSARVDEATLHIAKHLWETRRGKVATQFAGGEAGDTAPFMGYAIPRRAVELLSGIAAPGFA